MSAVKREQFWSKQNVPALLKWCGSDITEIYWGQKELHVSLTATRTLPLFQKDAFVSPSEFWQERFLLGNMWETLPARVPVTPLEPEMGWKMSVRYFLVFFPPLQKKNDVWFHLRKSEVKSTSARHKLPRGLWIWDSIMLSWCLEGDRGAECGPRFTKEMFSLP